MWLPKRQVHKVGLAVAVTKLCAPGVCKAKGPSCPPDPEGSLGTTFSRPLCLSLTPITVLCLPHPPSHLSKVLAWASGGQVEPPL